MDTVDEWYYSELLDLLKQKERQKEESYYRQIELELPFMEPPPESVGETPQEGTKDRGVTIIES